MTFIVSIYSLEGIFFVFLQRIKKDIIFNMQIVHDRWPASIKGLVRRRLQYFETNLWLDLYRGDYSIPIQMISPSFQKAGSVVSVDEPLKEVVSVPATM